MLSLVGMVREMSGRRYEFEQEVAIPVNRSSFKLAKNIILLACARRTKKCIACKSVISKKTGLKKCKFTLVGCDYVKSHVKLVLPIIELAGHNASGSEKSGPLNT